MMRILYVECVSASHSHTLLGLFEQTFTESSPNNLNAKQWPWALAKKTIMGRYKEEERGKAYMRCRKMEKLRQNVNYAKQ